MGSFSLLKSSEMARRTTPSATSQLGDRAPAEADLARAGGEVPGDEAEQARLARAVRPHDPDSVPRTDGQRKILRDDDPAEPLRHVIELNQRARHPVTS